MRSTIVHLLLITVAAVVVLFSNLGGPQLWDRDEPRNAGCAAEMIARGDWVTPVFDGELRAHKPVLLYWFMMSAYAVWGVTEFAARFWSAMFALGTVCVTYGIGRRLFSPSIGLWSALILLSTLMFDVAARAATPDSLLIFWSTAAIGVFVWGKFPRSDSDGARYTSTEPSAPFLGFAQSVLMYACMGMAVLAKGPVGLVLPTAVIGLYLLIDRLPHRRSAPGRRDSGWRVRVGRMLRPLTPGHFLSTCWVMRPITALAVVALVALPWYLAVAYRTDGQWVRGFLLDHNLGRAARPLEGHGGPIFYYLVALLVGFFPWSVFAVPTWLHAVRRLADRDRQHSGYLLAVCWIGVYIGIFSLARTKLPSYITPCYPAVALLVGSFIEGWARRSSGVASYWPRVALLVLAGIGIATFVAIPWAVAEYLPGERALALLGLIPLTTALLAGSMLRRDQPQAAAVCFAVGALMLTTTLFAVAAQRVARHQTFDVLVQVIDRYEPHCRVGVLGQPEPSWVFYVGRPLDRLHAAELDCASESENDPEGGYKAAPGVGIPTKQSGNVWQFLRGGSDRLAITTASQLAQLDYVPDDIVELARTPYFLRRDALVLLGTRSASLHIATHHETADRRSPR
jgi:4-amino-4-deoxy-L-arabinose transferase-like glycosyltransferase